MEGGKEGRTNRLYNISENTTHCPLCVSPNSNKDCHYWFIYVCVSVEWMQIHSCPCTGSLLFSSSELRRKAGGVYDVCSGGAFLTAVWLQHGNPPPPEHGNPQRRALCQPVRPSVTDTTQKRGVGERYLVSAWVNARASRAPPAIVVSCQVSRAKPPCSVWRAPMVVRKWMPAESTLVEIREWAYPQRLFVFYNFYIFVYLSVSTILVFPASVTHN